MTLPNKTERRAIVDTHRHPIGPKLAAKMAERGLYDPKKELPQTNDKDLMCYREFFDLEYAMPKQREDTMGFSAIGVRAAVEMCGVDRVVFGSDYGPILYGIKEHVQIVEDVLPNPTDRQQVFWKTSNGVFHLSLADTDLVTPRFAPVAVT
jgi:hypothetical protein